MGPETGFMYLFSHRMSLLHAMHIYSILSANEISILVHIIKLINLPYNTSAYYSSLVTMQCLTLLHIHIYKLELKLISTSILCTK